jgi:GT2 family glycosyltransferase
MLSTIVCTRNRVDLLEGCLQSLVEQDSHEGLSEIIVVDNGSTDGTRAFVEAFARSHPAVRYIHEPRPGLSRARNAGVRAAAFSHVAFIDDDGRVRPDFLRVAESVIARFDYDCFGGWVVPWYRTPKPAWLPETFGSYRKWRDSTGPLERGQDLPGGILIVRKAALEQCGGFPEHLGMRGSTIGYGEENALQQKLRKQGRSIGFCPDLVLSHLVAEYKFGLVWHLRRQFALARDRRALRKPLTPVESAWAIVRGITVPLPLLCYNSRKFVQNKPYYWQNWILDSFREPLRALGAAAASLRGKAADDRRKPSRRVGREVA